VVDWLIREVNNVTTNTVLLLNFLLSKFHKSGFGLIFGMLML
jgi:hypothetical protein